MSGRGKHGRQSWRTKMRNAMMKGTGCTFRDYEVGDAYRHLIGAKPEDEVFGRLATTPGGEVQMLRKTLIKMGRMLPRVVLDDRVSSELLTYLPAELKAALATTPGGGLPAQAAMREAIEAYLAAFDAGTGTVYVEPLMRKALKPAGDGGEA